MADDGSDARKGRRADEAISREEREELLGFGEDGGASMYEGRGARLAQTDLKLVDLDDPATTSPTGRTGRSAADRGSQEMLEPIMWRAVALHPSSVAISELIHELAGGEDDRDHFDRRDAVLREVARAVEAGLLDREADGSIVATEEAMFVNQFIDNKHAPPLEGEIADLRDAFLRAAARHLRAGQDVRAGKPDRGSG